MNQKSANKPLTCMKIRVELRKVQIRKQVAFCPSCKAEIEATEKNHPRCCEACGEEINWQGFPWLRDEVIKLYPAEE